MLDISTLLVSDDTRNCSSQVAMGGIDLLFGYPDMPLEKIRLFISRIACFERSCPSMPSPVALQQAKTAVPGLLVIFAIPRDQEIDLSSMKMRRKKIGQVLALGM